MPKYTIEEVSEVLLEWLNDSHDMTPAEFAIADKLGFNLYVCVINYMEQGNLASLRKAIMANLLAAYNLGKASMEDSYLEDTIEDFLIELVGEQETLMPHEAEQWGESAS